jgi:hypothetical protein
MWARIRADARRIALEEYKFWDNGKRIESEPATPGVPGIPERLRAYWNAANALPRTDRPFWATPWSAAFISYVLKQAGAGLNFNYAAAHRVYVHWAIQNAQAKPPIHPVQAHPVLVVRPRVGDLVCSWRDSRPMSYDTLRRMAAPPSEHPMHCDIVTEVEPNKIWVVGGNKTPVGGAKACPPGETGCTVNRTDLSLTPRGFLEPLTRKKNGQLESGWIAVMRIGP